MRCAVSSVRNHSPLEGESQSRGGAQRHTVMRGGAVSKLQTPPHDSATLLLQLASSAPPQGGSTAYC